MSDDARLVDLSPDLLAAVARGGVVRRANRAWSAVLPWTAEGFDIEAARERVHPDDRELFAQTEAELIAGRAVAGVPLRIHDGTEYREISWDGFVDGTDDTVLLRGRDMTDANRRAASLERTNADLQEFAYVVSHDLSEPLRMITSYLDLIERRYDDKLDDAGREFIRFAVDGATRMRALIDDLLVYSRVGGTVVSAVPVDLDETLDLVRHDLAGAIADAGAQVRSEPLGEVSGDPIQVRQLLQNLIANAIKFRGEREPVVDVRGERRGDGYHLTVSDNGIGIDPRHTERIFHVFTRLHSREEYPGTGIGLSICRRIVERHRGTIEVASKPGVGTTFTVVLPIDRGAEPEGTP